MKNKDILEVFDFYEHYNINRDDKAKFRKLFVELGYMSSFCEHRFIPTGKVKLIIVASNIKMDISQTLEFRDLIDSDEISIYSLSKIAISKLEEQNLDSNNFSIKADIYTEFEVYGYAGDEKKKYPAKEYRHINSGFLLYCKNDLEKIDEKYKDFEKYKKSFLKNRFNQQEVQ